MSRQENVPMHSGNWCGRIKSKQTVMRENIVTPSNSTRKLVQGATPKPEFQNMEYTIHQYMSKIFSFLQKKLGMSVSDATFSIQAYNATSCLVLSCFVFTRMLYGRRAALQIAHHIISSPLMHLVVVVVLTKSVFPSS